MKHDITITEADRQILLQGLAYLAHDRPAWDRTIRRIAVTLHGLPVLDAFLALRRYEPTPEESATPTADQAVS